MTAKLIPCPQAKPWLVRSLLVLSDALGFAFALSLATLLRLWFGGSINLSEYLGLWPVVLVFSAVAALYRLYSTIPQHPAEELRRFVSVVAVVFLVMAALTFLRRDADDWSRGAFIMALPLAVIIVPISPPYAHSSAALHGGRTPLVLGGADSAPTLPPCRQTPLEVYGRLPLSMTNNADLLGVPCVGTIEEAKEQPYAHRQSTPMLPGVSGPVCAKSKPLPVALCPIFSWCPTLPVTPLADNTA